MAYIITGAYTSSLSPVTPYSYGGGVVYVLAFDAIGDYETSNPSTLRAFKSTDSGQTWATAGGGTKQVLTRVGLVNTTRVITREHPEWPTQPYLYALYVSTSEQLHISRYNALTEVWDQESTGDLDVVEALPGGFQQFHEWSFDFVDDGDAGGLLYNDDAGYQHTNLNYYARVSYVPITRSSLSFGAAERLDGQPDDDIVFRSGDVRRGRDGTLHGFLSQSDPAGIEPATTYQAVLRYTGAGPGAPSLATFATGVEGIPYAAQREERGGNTCIYVLTTTGASYALHVGQSATAGITFAELFDAAGDGGEWLMAVAPNADIYRAWPSPAEDLERQTYDGSTLGALAVAYDGTATIGTVGAGAFTGGSACVFSIGLPTVAAQPLYFVGVAPLQLLGGEGIKSEEAFGRTHGLTGGGDPQSCGTPVIIPPSPTCGPIDVTEVPEEQRDACPTYGYSY